MDALNTSIQRRRKTTQSTIQFQTSELTTTLNWPKKTTDKLKKKEDMISTQTSLLQMYMRPNSNWNQSGKDTPEQTLTTIKKDQQKPMDLITGSEIEENRKDW